MNDHPRQRVIGHFEDTLDATLPVTETSEVVSSTHRCRIYQCRKNAPGAIFEVWDTLEYPHSSPPATEPVHTVTDSSPEKVKGEMTTFLEQHDIVSFGSWDGRGF